MSNPGRLSRLLRASLATSAILVASLHSPQRAHAEGSADVIASGGSRPYLEYRNDVTVGSTIQRRTVVKVYVEPGETLLVASSANGSGNGRVRCLAPDGTVYLAPVSQGVIATLARETAGPLPNAGGYTPFRVVAGPGQTGVWQVYFVAPDSLSGTNGPQILVGAAWTQPNNVPYVCAWDATVRKPGGATATGRAYVNQLAMNMGGNSAQMSSQFHVLTRDGFLYRVDANNVQPFGFNFFANNKGFRDVAGIPLYRSVPLAGSLIQDPDDDDTATDVTHKIFFNTPAADLPASASTPFGTTWLRLAAPFVPTATNFRFVGVDGTPGQAGSALGGYFRFDSDANGNYSVAIDLDDNGVFTDAIDRTLVGVAIAGANQIFWDGRDGLGAPAPSTPAGIAARVQIQGGEVHFPYIDAETNASGIILERQNGPGAPNYTVYFDDAALGGATALPPTGASSVTGAHVWGTNFGDVRGMDTWTYVPGALVNIADRIRVRQADLELVSKTHAPQPLVRGAAMTWTLVVRNNGVDSVRAAAVQDTLPAAVQSPAVQSAIASGGGVVRSSAITAGVFDASVDLPPAATATFVISGIVSPAAGASLQNRAFVLRTDDTGDLDDLARTGAGNNSKRDTATVVDAPPDLSLDKRHTAAFQQGASGTYTFVVTNVGAGLTTGAITVTDTLPAGLAFASGAGAGWTIGASGQVVTATNAGPIAPGDSSTFTLTVDFGPTAVPGVTNRATVSTPGDAGPGNDRDADPATVAGLPDLSMDKRHTTAFVSGSVANYTIVVTNVGTAPTVGTITVVDTLPALLTWSGTSAPGWTTSVTGQVLTATHPGPLAVGDSLSFHFFADIALTSATVVNNAAVVNTPGDADPANDRDVDPAAVGAGPDLSLDKRHTSGFLQGANGTYAFVVTNVGAGSTYAQVTVTDTLPAGLAFVSGAGAGWTFFANGAVVTATNPGPIAAGDSSAFAIVVSVSAAAVPGVTNHATVSTQGDGGPGNDRDADPTTVAGLPDLRIDKRHTTAFVSGGLATYRIVVTNAGTAPTAATITVVDTLPALLAWNSTAAPGWTVNVSGQVLTATHPGPLAVGDSLAFGFDATIGATGPVVVTNAAVVNTPGNADPNGARDVDPATVGALPDLSLDKRHTSAFGAGTNGTYTFVVWNVGTGTTTSAITVRDTLPAGLGFVSGAGAGWTIGASGQVVTATSAGPIAAGDSASFTLTVSVGAAAIPAVTNSATVSTPGDVTPGNDRDSDPTAIAGGPDLALDKRHTTAFAQGTNHAYAFVVTNVGVAPTTGAITVRDTLPAGLAFVSGAGAGWTIGASGQVVTATNAGPIAAGDSSAFSVVVTVGAAAVPGVTNSATVSTPGDLTPGNDRDSDPTSVAGVPDLSLDKRHTTAFSAGTNGLYTFVVRNVGTAPTFAAITVRDTLPAGLGFVSGAGAGWTIGASGQVVSATSAGPIAAGDSSAFTLTVSVGAAAQPAVTNSATASTPGDVAPGNDRDSDPTAVGGTPDLSLDKRHTAALAQGANATYTLVTRNVGTAPTFAAITVRDTLPAGLGFVSGTGAGWTIGASGPVVTATNAGPIAAGDSSAFTLTVSVGAAAVPAVTNFASVSTPGDLVPGNDRDGDPATVGGLVDLAIEKHHTGTFVAGGMGDYVITVRNVGTIATSSTVVVRDTLPAGVTFASASTPGWTFAHLGQLVTASHAGFIAAGDSASFTLTVSVNPNAPASVANFATVIGNGDGNPGNDRDGDVAPVTAAPDVSVDKRHTAAIISGHDAVYTLVVRNVGNTATSGAITVRDTLPAGLTFVSGSGAGWTISHAAGVVTAVQGATLLAGDSTSFTLTASVTAAAATNLTNYASVTTPGDVDPGNDRDGDPATVQGDGALALDKTASPAQVELGGDVDYTVTVRNTGAGPLTNVKVADQLPPGFRYVSGSARVDGSGDYEPTGAPGPHLVFPIGTLASLQVAELTYRVQVGVGATLGNGTNTAVASATAAGGGTIASNTGAATVKVRGGVFSDDAIIIGKVVNECDCAGDARQGAEDLGIPGVRLYLEDGTSVVTDEEGKFSLQNLRPRTHVLRIDSTTLPPYARMNRATNRHTDDGLAAIVDLQRGELHRVDFYESSRDSVTRAAVLARRHPGAITGAIVDAGAGGAPLPATSAGDSVQVTPPATPRAAFVNGLVEGRIDLRSLRTGELAGMQHDRFEDALLDASSTSNDGRTQMGARGAVFAKGTVLGSSLLTLRYDSEADASRRLFRDLQPGEGYGVMGDASLHGFEAQSTSRLYARLDHGDSHAMFGDLITPSSEARQLGAFTRSLTGGEAQVGNGRVTVGGFASQGTSHQRVDEIPALGISGPYALSRTDGRSGSEVIELVTRDRNQPARILSRQRLQRFTDYTLEPFTGRLLFTRPVASMDADLNPVSIRASYEVEGGSETFWTYGAEAGLAVTPRFVFGAHAARDEDPTAPRDIVSADARLQLATGVRLVAEAARSDSGGSAMFDSDKNGSAVRGELLAQGGRVNGRAWWSSTDRTFDNPSSGATPGREEFGVSAHGTLAGRTSLLASALRSHDRIGGGTRSGWELGLGQALGERLRAELACRHGEESSTPADARTSGVTPFTTNSGRGRVDLALPTRLKSGVFGEFEQSFDDADARRTALGAQVQVAARTRLYARYEDASSLAGPWALTPQRELRTAVVGIESDEWRDGHVFTEYRARDAFAGRDVNTVFGLRNRWRVAPGLRLDAGFERILGARGSDADAVSLTGALEWTGDPRWKGTLRGERREDRGSEQRLLTAGVARKLSRDWTAIGDGWLVDAISVRWQDQVRAGVAYRQTEGDRWDGLARVERHYERNGKTYADDHYERVTDVVRAHASWKPSPFTWTGQYAMRTGSDVHALQLTSFTAALYGTRLRVDLGSRLDAGGTLRLLQSDTGDARQKGVGAELGYRVASGMRAAAGYNWFGFKDDLLTGGERTDRGPYLSLGWAFDQGWPGRDAGAVNGGTSR